MPLIALSLSLLFSTWLIVKDLLRRRGVGPAVWVPTLMVLILASRPVSMWLGLTGKGSGENPIDQLFNLSLRLGAVLIVVYRRNRLDRLIAGNKAVTAFYCFLLLSVLWSGDPVGSFKRWGKDVGLIAVAMAMLTEANPLGAVRAVYVRCGAVLLPLSIVLIKYYPQLGRDYSIAGVAMARGVTTQKNTLGEIAMFFLLFLVWDYWETLQVQQKFRLLRVPWDRLALFMVGFWALLLSDSKTSLVCVLLGAFLLLRRGWLASPAVNRAIWASTLAVPFLFLLTQQFASVIAPLIEALGRDMTFTGRTDIWAYITLDTVNPLIGAGFWNFWQGKGGDMVSEAMGVEIPNAHNGYLDTYLDGGMIGLCLLCFVLVTAGNRLIRGGRMDRYGQMRFAIVVVMILYNLSESTFARPSISWFTSLLALVVFPMKNVSRPPIYRPDLATALRSAALAKEEVV